MVMDGESLREYLDDAGEEIENVSVMREQK